MTPAQIQAITAMNLSRQDISTILQQAGIAMDGFGQGGGGFGRMEAPLRLHKGPLVLTEPLVHSKAMAALVRKATSVAVARDLAASYRQV